MTEAEARALLVDRLQPAAAPVLEAGEVDRLLAGARLPDLTGLLPGEDGYAATWSEASIAGAVADGFAMKAAKVVGAFDVKAGDVEAKRSQAMGALAAAESAYRRVASAGGVGSVGGIGVITTTTAIYEAWPLLLDEVW